MKTDIERVHPHDREALLALLTDHHLPVDGLLDHLETTLVARQSGRVVGSAGLEVYEDGALLRSVAVARSQQGHGLGHDLTAAAIQWARDLGVPAVYLLTTTAEGFFPKFGFERIRRAEVPPGVQASVEFTSACCASATVMRKRL
jgi:amino-acid N-acetyltransferase